jgi:type VI secretion system secreted protein VgrG
MPDGSVSQRNRLGKFHSPLGPDALVLVRFAGDEGVNQLGTYQIDVMSPGSAIDLDAVLGLHGTVEITTLQHGPRFYDGIITEAEIVDERQDGWLVRLVLRPWFWLAGLRRNQRIFHNKTAPQIIAEVLDDYAHTKTPRLRRVHKPIEYTVQYGESDLAFLCRMMERHGISYHFEHAKSDHAMVLTDAMEGFRAAPCGARMFHPVQDQHRATDEHFSVWSPARRVTTGRVKLTDYNFKTPAAAMPVDVAGDAAHAEGTIESFDYPGLYLAQGAGRGVARLRMDQTRGPDGLFAAEGDTASLSPGMLVGLGNHPQGGLNGKNYLLTQAVHSYVAEAYTSGAQADGAGDSYAGRYVFHPQDKPFQPAMVTPMARIYGPQTAVVVGKGEIDCDEYGRILVRFHWDLDAAHSMRCRVAQIWAGNGWGGMVIPRIGMEVLVEFLEGDPDKPLVTGCVYNGKMKVPYALPEHKTRSTFKTDTHQGQGYNELRFEDAKGEEEIFVHAQKDRNEKTLHNHTERIDNNWVQSVGHNKAIEVTNNHDEVIGGNMTLSVGPSSIGQIISGTAAKLAEGLGGLGRALGLPGMLNPGEGNQTITIEKNKGETVGIASMEAVGISKMTSVGKTYHINVGTKMVITCGKSQISIDKSGYVKITGVRFNFSASGPVQINGKDIDLN